MCGIAGIVGRAGGIRGQRPAGGERTSEHQIVERMVDALKHRGPDDEGISDCDQYTFGHTRLAIIDLSTAGHQPMFTSDGRYQIVYNGEIYNYRELRKQLEQNNVRFRSDTDTEVILHLFAKYHEKCLDFLEGMFAFAIADNHTGELFIARDRLGIKPLYYFSGKREAGSGQSTAYSSSVNTGRFLFASEIRALLASGLVPRRLDPISVNSYLSFGAVQEPHTILQGVRTLPPAHFMRVRSDGAIKEITRYWNLPTTNHVVTRAEALAQTRERFADSVKSHLVSDAPLGAFLSSGIDSSAIVAMMSRFAPHRVRTFSVCFNESEFSERHIASRVAEKWNTAHTEVFLSEENLLRSLPSAISDIDQPTVDGINTWAISRAVGEAGITVALSGVGGDELFGGYSSFRRVPALIRHAQTLNRVRGSKQFAAAALRLFDDSIAAQKISTALAGPTDPLSVYKSFRGLFGKDLRRSLTNGNGLIQADYDLPRDTQALLNEFNGVRDLFNRISRFELNLYMANMLLRDTDTMSMAHGLEVRVPLLDHKFVEWVYSLPGEMKSGRHSKSFFVEAMGDDLLPEVVHQKKMGFTLPFDRWLHTSLNQFVDGTLTDRESIAQAGLDYGIVQEVWRSFQHGRRSISWSRVWALVVLVSWCRENGVASDE